ncbi:MAG: YHYH protein [Cyanobacteria bacterium J06635_15]
MTQLPKPKTVLRSSRYFLPSFALLVIIWGLEGRQAQTYNPHSQLSFPAELDHHHAFGDQGHFHTHDPGALHPLDEILLVQNDSNQVSIQVQGDRRVVTANGIPQHATGSFPNNNNPNRISGQSYTFSMPANPTVANQITPLTLGKFGIALNGVPFDPGVAEFWHNDPNWQYEALAQTANAHNLGLDQNNAHVQPNGAYHYHGSPVGLLNRLGNNAMVLLGYAADGFPIYASQTVRSSYRLKSGQRPSNGPNGQYDGTFVQDYEYVAGLGDLDQCNGRGGATPEYPEGIYHYYITADFPSIPRCFRGTPDASFLQQGGGQGRPEGPPPGGRPPNSPPPRF